MAKYTGPVCKLCRREGQKLFLKGERCYFKCAYENRDSAPGEHGHIREKQKDYGLRLREKQKIRRIYGVLERQFRRYFHLSERQKGVTGENLLRILESRIDNIVYRSGFATSRNEARQLVLHNHFTINNRKVNIPSYRVKVGDVIQVVEKSRGIDRINNSIKAAQQRVAPEWLGIDQEEMRISVIALPAKDQIPEVVKEQLVVELYSK